MSILDLCVLVTHVDKFPLLDPRLEPSSHMHH